MTLTDRDLCVLVMLARYFLLDRVRLQTLGLGTVVGELGLLLLQRVSKRELGYLGREI